MSEMKSAIEVLWQERYAELEDTFFKAMTAIAENLGGHLNQGVGIQEVSTDVGPTSRVEVVALLSGPPQEVSFRVSSGSVILQEGEFGRSNTLHFEPPMAGRYLVECRSRVLGTDDTISEKAVEAIVQ